MPAFGYYLGQLMGQIHQILGDIQTFAVSEAIAA
jgi:hypothetical protein